MPTTTTTTTTISTTTPTPFVHSHSTSTSKNSINNPLPLPPPPPPPPLPPPPLPPPPPPPPPPPVQVVRQQLPRHRNRFDEARRSETAATRKEGACQRCRHSGSRCHKSHRQPLNPSSTSSLQNNASFVAAVTLLPPPPPQAQAQHDNHYNHHQPDPSIHPSIHRFMEDASDAQGLNRHFAPQHFSIGVGERPNPTGYPASSAAPYGSQSINGFALTQPYAQLLSNSYSSNQNTKMQPHLPYTQSTPAPDSFFPGPVSTTHPRPLASTNMVIEQSYPPVGGRQYGNQSQSIWSRSPSIASPLPPQFGGLSQISEPIYGLQNVIAPPCITTHPLPNNCLRCSHAVSQFENMDLMNAYYPLLETFDQLSNHLLSTFATPSTPMNLGRGLENTSFQMNPGLQPQWSGGQTIMNSQGGSFGCNMQQGLPLSYLGTFSHDDDPSRIPPSLTSQAGSDVTPQYNILPDDPLGDPVLDFKQGSMLVDPPSNGSNTVNSSFHNTLLKDLLFDTVLDFTQGSMLTSPPSNGSSAANSSFQNTSTPQYPPPPDC